MAYATSGSRARLFSSHLQLSRVESAHGSSGQAYINNSGNGGCMDYCPLVQHVKNIQFLRQFEQTGHVTIPLSDWLRFFEALAHLSRDRDLLEIQCAIVGEHLIFSRTPFRQDAKRKHQLFYPASGRRTTNSKAG